MKIEVRYEKITNEFTADVEISPHRIIYIASYDIKTLCDEIYEILWNYRNNI